MNDERIKLFCIPFSGGNGYSYTAFRQHLAENIEMINLELPGRGKRISEPLLTNVEEMTADLYGQIRDSLNKPYAIYGHSLGALLGYTLCRYISENGDNLPLILIFSGQNFPSFIENDEKYKMPDDEFINILREMEGTPEELLSDRNFTRFFLPVIRADFQAAGTYSYSPPRKKLEIPVSVMLGSNEKIEDEEAAHWQLETTGAVSIDRFEGGHFFIYAHTEDICRLISEKIEIAAL
ncbi:MAG: thioesterase II family protein [Syntrophothermus sp.]